MAANKKKRIVKSTIIVVGEGPTEKAFLLHLRRFFQQGERWTSQVVDAGGKGPSHIMEHAISCKKHRGYGYGLVLLDTDLEWPNKLCKEAKRNKILLVPSTPCLEGLLFDILGECKPDSSQECKKAFMSQYGKKVMTDKDDYAELFSEEVLIQAKDNCHSLKLIIDVFQGNIKKHL